MFKGLLPVTTPIFTPK